MPPRYAYWTIIAGGLPTAFRATDRDELQPTFSRIKEKHPDAEMKWFARGKLWDSPESARRDAEAQRRARAEKSERPRSDRQRFGEAGGQGRRTSGDTRGRDWRPGGEHRDPRQKFKDARKARNVDRRRQKFERKQRSQERTPDLHSDRRPPRRFETRSFTRNQGTGEPQNPPPPPGPTREPRPKEGIEPTPPPRPSEPVTTPPGPPERGRPHRPTKRGRFSR